MSKANESVFPIDKSLVPDIKCMEDGLTKRELFAAMALIGLNFNAEYDSVESVAHLAVKQADALLKELEE